MHDRQRSLWPCSPADGRLKLIDSWDREFEVLAGFARSAARRRPAPAADITGDGGATDGPPASADRADTDSRPALRILEAGCGCAWGLDLGDVPYHLTGVDVDRDALEIRRRERADLDEAVVGDLRTVELPAAEFDLIYNSYVLEHIEGAERVLDNFLRWLRPGGLLILRIPDRDSVYGWLTRLTPLRCHVWYKRWIVGFRDAGKPGVGPFPTVYDKIVSRAGIRRWCAERGVAIRAEFGSNYYTREVGIFGLPLRLAVRTISILSLGRLAADHNNLTYVLQKAATAAPAPDADPEAEHGRQSVAQPVY